MAALLTAQTSDYSQVMATASTDTLTDERALIEKAKRSDSRAFEGLYRMHINKVYGVCLRMTGNVSEAEDCAQEAFIQAWKQLCDQGRSLNRRILTYRRARAAAAYLSG